MAEVHHFDNCYMHYFSNDLINFHEICIVMHTSHSYPIGNQQIENLKI